MFINVMTKIYLKEKKMIKGNLKIKFLNTDLNTKIASMKRLRYFLVVNPSFGFLLGKEESVG